MLALLSFMLDLASTAGRCAARCSASCSNQTVTGTAHRPRRNFHRAVHRITDTAPVKPSACGLLFTRALVVVAGTGSSITTGLRTAAGTDPRYCAAAAFFLWHGAVSGAARKNRAWLSCKIPQGDAFFALCHETSGHMGDSAHDFFDTIIDSAGGVDNRMVFKVYALQRVHAAHFRGVAAVINPRQAIRTRPGAPPWVRPAASGCCLSKAGHQL